MRAVSLTERGKIIASLRPTLPQQKDVISGRGNNDLFRRELPIDQSRGIS
jgi:hypothetical protein